LRFISWKSIKWFQTSYGVPRRETHTEHGDWIIIIYFKVSFYLLVPFQRLSFYCLPGSPNFFSLVRLVILNFWFQPWRVDFKMWLYQVFILGLLLLKHIFFNSLLTDIFFSGFPIKICLHFSIPSCVRHVQPFSLYLIGLS
jgi:hypothetical protein